MRRAIVHMTATSSVRFKRKIGCRADVGSGGHRRQTFQRLRSIEIYLRILKIAMSVARPLSVSVYAPLSRLCAMNPRMAMDCIACARMPTAAWSMPVAAQNRIKKRDAPSSRAFVHPTPSWNSGRDRNRARRAEVPTKDWCAGADYPPLSAYSTSLLSGAGEAIARLLPLPVSGAIIGLPLLFALAAEPCFHRPQDALRMLRSPPADRHAPTGCQSYREHQISDLA
jgi:hypothetical protein